MSTRPAECTGGTVNVHSAPGAARQGRRGDRGGQRVTVYTTGVLTDLDCLRAQLAESCRSGIKSSLEVQVHLRLLILKLIFADHSFGKVIIQQ